MKAATKLAAYWDWTSGAPVPDARIVVCAPQMLTTASVAIRADAHLSREQSRPAVKALNALIGAEDAGTMFVVPDADPMVVKIGCVPALHVRTQADLARLPDLLAVKAERRALVCSPEEAIDLEAVFACPQCRGYGVIDSHNNPCVHCDKREPAVDVVFIVGLDEPVHPEWVRSIVEQCRAAGVPCVFVGWGEWMPGGAQSGITLGDIAEHNGQDACIGDCCYVWPDFSGYMARVGAARSGALLDGVVIEDVPVWLGGEG